MKTYFDTTKDKQYIILESGEQYEIPKDFDTAIRDLELKILKLQVENEILLKKLDCVVVGLRGVTTPDVSFYNS